MKAERERDDREWDDLMASPTRWTWVWESSGSWWWTGKRGVLQYMGLWELNMTEYVLSHFSRVQFSCDPMDHGLSGSSVHEILQARILEWVASSFSSDKVWNEWSEWSKVIQSCPTLCDPMGCSLPGSSVHGIFQARVLEWVTISFSNWVTELNLNYISVYM